MKHIFISIFICLVFNVWVDGCFSTIAFAESDIEVIGTEPPEFDEFDEDEPITQEMIDEEEELLEQKIREVNETPVEEYGSLVLKRKKRAYYFHRLQLLRDNPEKYFKTKTKTEE